MAEVGVVVDSSCDLPPSAVTEWGIELVPLTIRFGSEEFVDRRDLSPQDFWVRCQGSPVLPETAAPAPGAFEAAFKKLANNGAEGVVCVCLSGKLSATGQAAEVAAKAVGDDIPVRIIDSRSASLGVGMIALAAARVAADGKGLEDVAGAAEDLVPRTRVYAALDTLENLKKGGRVGGAQALLGSMLSLKPIIELRDGAVEAESRQRTRARALRYLSEKLRNHGNIENLAVLHGDAPDIEDFLDTLGNAYPRDQIVVGQLGAVIGTHAGPRAIGVAFHVGD